MPLIGEKKNIVYSTQGIEQEQQEQELRELEWIDQQEEETNRLTWLLEEEERQRQEENDLLYWV